MGFCATFEVRASNKRCGVSIHRTTKLTEEHEQKQTKKGGGIIKNTVQVRAVQVDVLAVLVDDLLQQPRIERLPRGRVLEIHDFVCVL